MSMIISDNKLHMAKKRKIEKNNLVRLFVVVEPAQKKFLEGISEEQGWSIGRMVRYIVDQYAKSH
jgi:hypothetical protein